MIYQKVNFNAIQTEQNGIRMFVGVGRAKALINVTTIDHYKPELEPADSNQGYQRPPERSRITRIGSFLLNNDHLLFPTAVLLSSREPVDFDRKQCTVEISSENPLHIVDGQHRLEGLKYAIEERDGKHLEDMPLPFIIIETNGKLLEMDQFRTVNGTAKSVRTDLVNMILTAVYKDKDRSEIPPVELRRIVLGNVVDRLNKDSSSPWYGSIVLPGDTASNNKIIRATSIISSLTPVYSWLKEIILDQECKNQEDEIEYVYNIVANYWNALKAVVPRAFDDPNEYVIQKTPGLFSLHKLLKRLLYSMYRGRREFNVETFKEFLSESPEVLDPDFWHIKAQRASMYGNMKGFQDLYELLSDVYRR